MEWRRERGRDGRMGDLELWVVLEGKMVFGNGDLVR